MRFRELWSDWRGGRNAQQIVLPGASVDNGGTPKTGGIAITRCGNRYLSWYCCANVLELTEISLDDKLTDNAVDIILTEHIVPSSIVLCDYNDVMVTFVTTALVYWIQLPHPQALVDKGMSILSSVTMDTIRAASHGMTITIDTMMSSLISPRGTFFVCSNKGGVVFMLPPHSGANNVTTVEVVASSKGVVERMWHGFMYSSATMATDTVIDVALFVSGDDLVAMASCHDSMLRLFSHKQQRVMITYPLSKYIPGVHKADVVAIVKANQSTSQTMKFAVFTSLEDRNLVLIFTMDSSHDLDLIYSTSLSPEYSLLQWQLSDKELWLVLSNADGDTVVKHAIHQCGSSSVLLDVAMVADPEVILSNYLSPRESYLDHITLHYPPSVIKAVIKSMEYDEDGSHDLSTMNNIRSAMCHVVENEIQQQVLGSCGPQEYRQHQLRQWDRLLGYIRQYNDEQCRPPGGLLIDSNNGLTLLLGRQCASLMIPYVNPVDLVNFVVTKKVKEKDVNVLLQCVAMVTKMLSDDDKTMLSSSHGNDVDITAASLALDIVARGNYMLLAEFKERINNIQNITVAMKMLVNYLNPSSKDVNDRDNDDMLPSHDSLHIGDIATVTMVAAIRQLVSGRISLCQHIIIMFHLYKLVGTQYIKGEMISTLSDIVKSYRTIQWLTLTTCQQPDNAVDIDATLERLNISDRLPEQQLGKVTLLESILRGRLGSIVRTVVARRLAGSDRCNWRCAMPVLMDVTIETLWSSSWSLVCNWLLTNHQYLHAQTYLRLLPSDYRGDPLYAYCLALSLLPSEPDKSCDLFINAVFMGITSHDEFYMHFHGNADESCDPRLIYYRKVISVMEQFSVPVDRIIVIVKNALLSVSDSAFQSLLFKLLLQLCQFEDAYNAMIAINEHSRRMDCLRHFINVLIDKNERARLCNFPFFGMENEVEDIIEARARSLDITTAEACYNILYCYHICRSNYRKGAIVMYEAAHRTGIEVTNDLQSRAVQYRKQRDFYLVSLICLKVCSHDYQWLVRPANNDKEDLEVVTYRDISQEYDLVNAKCELLRIHPDVISELTSDHMSPQEVISLLVQHGLFDVAFQLGQSLQLPLDTVYDNLAARCVSLTKSFATIEKLKLSGSSQSDDLWKWVGYNDPDTIINTRETTVVDNAWLLLQKHLMTAENCKRYQKCVARRIVSMGGTIPQWLIDHYKRTDANGLLLLYVDHNLLEEALLLATEYINAASGHGAEYFGMDRSNSVVWLPHNTFSYLSVTVEASSEKTRLDEVYKQFVDKWSEYLRDNEINIS